ncbi:hypothetical protein ANANG_G00123290, partial [Anguilla anguilla]
RREVHNIPSSCLYKRIWDQIALYLLSWYRLYTEGRCQQSGTAKRVSESGTISYPFLYHSEMGDAMLHVANLSTMLSCMVLKLPQIFLLTKLKSTKGVSLRALLLELTGYIVFVTYQMSYEYPLPTYMEYPVLISQDTILLFLILHYNGNLRQSVIYSTMFVGGWQLLTRQKWILDLAMSLCTFISAGSKFVQLQCLWESKDSSRISALSWTMSTYTCMARIFTTVMTTGDLQVMARFIVMTALNVWVTATVLYYKQGGKKLD